MSRFPNISAILKSDVSKGSFVYGSNSAFNALIGFLVLPVFTRYLSAADYGRVEMFWLVVTFVSPVVSLVVHGAVHRRYFDKKESDLPTYIGTAVIITGTLSLIIAFIAFILPGRIFRLFQVSHMWIVLAVIIAGVNTSTSILHALYRAKNAIYKVFALDTARNVIQLSLSLFLVIGMGFAWKGRVLGGVIISVLLLPISLFLIRKESGLKLTYRESSAKHMWSFGGPLIFHATAANIIFLSDRLFISHFVDVATMGVYVVGAQFGGLVATVVEAFNKAWSPWLYGSLGDEKTLDRAFLVRVSYSYFGLILLCALGVGLLSPYIIRWVVPGNFAHAGQYVLWIGLGFAFNGMYRMVAGYLFYKERTRLVAASTVISAMLNVVLNYVLVRHYGALGVAYATAISFFVSFLMTWFFAMKVCPLPWFSFLRPG